MHRQHSQRVQPLRARHSQRRSSRARTVRDAVRWRYESTSLVTLSLSQTPREATLEAAVSPHVVLMPCTVAWRWSYRSGQKTYTTSPRRNGTLCGGVIVETLGVVRSIPCRLVAVLHELGWLRL